MIYFDNAATSYPKPPNVIKAVNDALRAAGNPGRSLHEPAVWASENIYLTRTKVAKLFNIEDPMNVAFTLNGTAAINFALNLCKTKVLTTSMEHNSVLRPLSQRGYYDVVWADNGGNLPPERVISSITPTTGAVVMTHGSNVTGNIYDIETVGRFCRRKGITFIVDASQTAGVAHIDVQKMCIDILCCTGHKGLLGMQGVGVIYISPKIKLSEPPLIKGGTGSMSLILSHPMERPDYFEAGTVNTHGIVSVGAGIDYISDIGIKNILCHEQRLRELFYKKLSQSNKIEIYGNRGNNYTGTISFNIKGKDSTYVSDLLASEGICVRGGFHCAPLAHKTIGTLKSGTVRASLGLFNTEKEVNEACDKILEI